MAPRDPTSGDPASARIDLPRHPARRIVRIAAFAALAIVGRVAFLAFPNVALTYAVVFLAGVVEGAWAGLFVGLLAMTVTNLMLSGLHPVLFVNGPAMGLIGVVGGLLAAYLRKLPGDRLDRALRLAVLAATGFFATLLFSVASDLAGYALAFFSTPEGRTVGTAALGPYLLAGLAFNLIPALVNAVLFAAVTPPLLHALERAGQLRSRRRRVSHTNPTPPPSGTAPPAPPNA